MSKNREYDRYLEHLDSEDHRVLNAYMDNLDLENNSELDAYLDRIEEGRGMVDDIQTVAQPEAGMTLDTTSGIYGADTIQDTTSGIYNAGMESDATFETQGVGMSQQATSGLGSFIELEPEIENFQDYTTARMKPVNNEEVFFAHEEVYDPDEIISVINPDNPLNVSLLDEEYEQPYVDTLRYKDDEDIIASEKKSSKNNRTDKSGAGKANNNRVDDYDSVYYVDNIPKQRKAPIVLAILCILLILGGGVYATYHFTDGFKDFTFFKKEPVTESDTEVVVTTEATTEEATTEEPAGPYATVDYTLHTPHVTDDTIVYNSNPYSLRYPAEEWPIQRDDNGEQRDATQEELYPAITLEAHEGSLNSTSPNPDNLAETQQMTSRYMVLVDLSDDSIVAKRDSDIVVNPASMTKILTVLTAADMIEDLDDTFIMTDEAVRYAYDHDGSAVGFLTGEKVTVRDLIYGTIVCSGADAAVGLAQYCCGSHDAFVEKMNEKAEELGISDTAHFTNVVGMYDENLHCTMEDMAVILATAMQNDLLKEVLNTRIYQTTPDPNVIPEDVRKKLGISADGSTDAAASDGSLEGAADNDTSQEQDVGDTETTDNGETGDNADQTSEGENPEATTEEIDPGVLLIATDGIQISNWFMRRIEDKDTGGEVLGAKTGFVNAAGFCCASYYRSNSGREYVCVTGDTYSSWRCIYDHVGIYRSLTK
ncbi:MAG: D-alanyl-D-alanine carboxypeptidase [Lachnospiraceae bacterium]|nr:D-alanyl-D-alanine carboxypeptidase [Lachnospiraceae bacterium]